MIQNLEQRMLSLLLLQRVLASICRLNATFGQFIIVDNEMLTKMGRGESCT